MAIDLKYMNDEIPPEEEKIVFPTTSHIELPHNYNRNSIKVGIATLLILYAVGGLTTGAWTPKQIKAYNQSGWINRELKYAKTYEDSINIYKKFNFPMIFQEPPIKEKKVMKQNELEKRLK